MAPALGLLGAWKTNWSLRSLTFAFLKGAQRQADFSPISFYSFLLSAIPEGLQSNMRFPTLHFKALFVMFLGVHPSLVVPGQFPHPFGLLFSKKQQYALPVTVMSLSRHNFSIALAEKGNPRKINTTAAPRSVFCKAIAICMSISI
jgi:hypothetical protein